MALTRNEIIESALDIAGITAAEEDPSDSETKDSAQALNTMIQRWQAKSPHLWKRDEGSLFLQPAQVKYQLGGGSTDHATLDFTETTTDADAIATATVLSLTSSTGLAVGDNISVRLDSGALFWSTVTIVSPVTLNDALPSAAASGAAVYYYTTDLDKALRVPDARRLQGTGVNTTEIEMVQLGRTDYLNLPNKKNSGTPVQFYYDPKQTFGNMYVWPAPTKVDPLIKFTTLRPFVGFTSPEDTGEFPDEWEETLIYNLAVRMASRFGMTLKATDVAIAQNSLRELQDWDQGDAPMMLQFSPGLGQ